MGENFWPRSWASLSDVVDITTVNKVRISTLISSSVKKFRFHVYCEVASSVQKETWVCLFGWTNCLVSVLMYIDCFANVSIPLDSQFYRHPGISNCARSYTPSGKKMLLRLNPLWKLLELCRSYLSDCRPRWSQGNVLASRSKVCGFKPNWGRWIFSGRKNLEHRSSGRDFKLGVASLRFQAR